MAADYSPPTRDESRSDHVSTAEDDAPSKSDLKALHKTAMARFRIGEEAYAEQSRRELADLKFANRKGQWTDAEQESRKGFTAAGISVPARPMLTIDKLRQPIQQLENQQRQANLAVNVSPSGGGATKDTAEMLQGLYRHIQVESRADQIARFWAYSRAVKTGRGVYRVERVYEQDHPKADDPARFDQKLKISRILNQAGVLLDPFATEPDWSDGQWGIIKSWVSHDDDRRVRGRASAFYDCDDDEFALIGANAPGWVRFDEDGNGKRTWAILVVEYLYLDYGEEETLTGPDGQERKVRSKTCYSCKINAKEAYDREDLEVPYVPLIPVIANEENIDGERLWEGIVGPAKDSQRTYNMMTTAFVETVALAPKAPWLLTVEQLGPYGKWWEQSNVRNFPYLPYVAKSEGGTQLPPPQRMFGEPPIQAIAQGIHQFDANINAVTGFFDPSRGNLSAGERSGVALQALQKQSETGNSGYLDNLAQISMTYEAKVILAWIPRTYDRPGRIASILGASDAPEQVMLNAPYVKGPQGQPLPAPVDANADDVVMHQLEAGVYASVVTIGKGQATARQETAELIGGIIQAEPQLLMLIGDLYFANLDGPGMPELAARMKKMLPPQLQEQPQGGQPDAAQLQQQVAQMTQQIQQLQPLADANQAKMQQAQMEAQAKLQQVQIDAASKEKIAQLEAQMKVEIEKVKAEADLQRAQMQGMSTTQAAAAKSQAGIRQTVIAEQAETERQDAQRAHEAAAHTIDLHHAAVSADTARVHEQAMSESDHAHARQLQSEKPTPKGQK